MKHLPVQVWEVEVYKTEEGDDEPRWVNYQYYTLSRDSSTVLKYLRIDEGTELIDEVCLIPNYSIQWDEEWSFETFCSVTGCQGEHDLGLICDLEDVPSRYEEEDEDE